MNGTLGIEQGAAAKRQLLLVVALSCSLYCFFISALPSSYGTPLAWVLAVAAALRAGAWADWWERYKVVALGLVILLMINMLAARLPGKVVSGVGELLRSVSLMLPAMLVARHFGPEAVMRWLVGATILISVLCAGIYAWNARADHIMWAIYVWSEEYLGNVHNLVNLVGVTVLALVVALRFGGSLLRLVTLLLCTVFLCAFLILLESEGTYLALGLTACAWLMVRYAGVLRLAGFFGLVGGVLGYVVLMGRPEVAQLAQDVSLGGFEARVLINAHVLELVAGRPLLGYGLNNFKYLPDAAVNGVSFLHPHQIYLEALFSLGVVGSLLFAAVLYGFFRFSSRQAILTEPLPMLGFLAAVYMAGKGLTDMKLMSMQPLAIFFLAAGFMARGQPRERNGVEA